MSFILSYFFLLNFRLKIFFVINKAFKLFCVKKLENINNNMEKIAFDKQQFGYALHIKRNLVVFGSKINSRAEQIL